MKTTTIATFLFPFLASLPALADKDDHIKLPANLDPALAAPAGEELSFVATGVGAQLYTCTASGGAYAWVNTPDAILLSGDGDADDRQIGIHYAGPTWANNKGSVQGSRVASVPSPGNVPWLRLVAVGHTGHGRFSQVTTILRLDTVGGVNPNAAAACNANTVGTVERVGYRATYFFFHLADEGDDDDDDHCGHDRD